VCVAAGAAASVAVGGACVDDSECDPGAYCDSTGTCVADPNAAGAADLGAPCYQDIDCASGEYCDLQTDTCVN
jgi:hypothetical protein